MIPDENDMISFNKAKALASIDVAMGGHVAEKIFLGDYKTTSGCSSDL
jgi:ATP-dependent Zn protease